jgi:hypothetical protein
VVYDHYEHVERTRRRLIQSIRSKGTDSRIFVDPMDCDGPRYDLADWVNDWLVGKISDEELGTRIQDSGDEVREEWKLIGQLAQSNGKPTRSTHPNAAKKGRTRKSGTISHTEERIFKWVKLQGDPTRKEIYAHFRHAKPVLYFKQIVAALEWLTEDGWLVCSGKIDWHSSRFEAKVTLEARKREIKILNFLQRRGTPQSLHAIVEGTSVNSKRCSPILEALVGGGLVAKTPAVKEGRFQYAFVHFF